MVLTLFVEHYLLALPHPDYLFVEVLLESEECVFPFPLLRAVMEASFVEVIYRLASSVEAYRLASEAWLVLVAFLRPFEEAA